MGNYGILENWSLGRVGRLQEVVKTRGSTVRSAPDDLFFSFFLTGGPFRCGTCVGSSEEECNSKVRIVDCGEGFDRFLATRYLKKDHFSRGCGNEIIFEYQKTKCAAESCEVSMCSESYCVA